ncbi:hypothetical protein N7467_004500 [Penicillium canescens]|nr:hypothetical protein N7467_004500 [Penicillium canescens]
MPPKDKYTDPKLRDKVKTEIHNSDKGGQPGQWSARKAQMMASEYKKRGGGYNTSKEGKDESQKHLDKWTKEEWQTKEGSGTARQDDDSRKRYLPKKAWEGMNEEEKEETEDKKVEGSKEGKQFVGNTGTAKEARKRVTFDIDGNLNGKGEVDGKGEADGKGKADGKSKNTKGEGSGKKAGTKRKAKSQPAEKDNGRIKSLRKRK